MKKSLLRSCLCYVWYVLATLIILIAVLSASLKALTPVLNEYKSDIERYLSRAVGQKVSIGSLHAHWERFGPQVDLKQVVLFDGDQAFLTAGEVDLHIGLSWLDSLTIRDMNIEVQEISPHRYLVNHLKTIELSPDTPLKSIFLRLQLNGIHFFFDLLGDISHVEGQLDAKLDIAAQRVTSEVLFSNSLIKRGQTIIPIQQLSGRVDLERDAQGWHLEGRNMQLNDQHFNLSYRDDQTKQELFISMERIRFPILLDWLQRWGICLKKQLIEGELASLSFYAVGSLSQGDFEVSADRGWVRLEDYFEQPVSIQRLYATGSWKRADTDHLDLQLTRLAATANHVNLSAVLALKLALKQPLQSWMSVVAGFQADHTTDLKVSVPLRLFPEGVQAWVNASVGEGEGAEGTVIMRGRLQDFPYIEHNGVFLVDAHVQPFSLDYLPDWPSIHHLSCHLIFSHDSMWADVSAAEVSGAIISQGSVRIPSFKNEAHLMIEGIIHDGANKILDFLRRSPLHAYADFYTMTGEVDGQLLLDFSLNPNTHVQPVIQGSVKFLNNSVAFNGAFIPLQLVDISGEVGFSREETVSHQLTARLLGQPIEIAIRSAGQVWDILLSGHADVPHIRLVVEGSSWHIEADYLRLFGIAFHALAIAGEKFEGHQSWRVTSQEATGMIQTPVDEREPITADMDRLILTTTADTTPFVTAEQVATWPALNLHVRQLMLNQENYSDVFLMSHPILNGIEATRFDIAEGKTQLRSIVQWTAGHQGETTHMKGTLRSKDAKAWLARHHWDRINVEAGTAKLDLTWDAAPWACSPLASLRGYASLKAEDGVIPIDENASNIGLGKVLSLFSTQSIERRLRLDFSDLGRDGYSFNTFVSELHFDDGNMYFSKTRFNGPQAKIDVTGRCGLVSKDYDMELTVTPYVTSTIPIIATIAGGPIIGAATYAIDQLFGSSIDRLNAYHYVLQGSWSHPVLTEKTK